MATVATARSLPADQAVYDEWRRQLLTKEHGPKARAAKTLGVTGQHVANVLQRYTPPAPLGYVPCPGEEEYQAELAKRVAVFRRQAQEYADTRLLESMLAVEPVNDVPAVMSPPVRRVVNERPALTTRRSALRSFDFRAEAQYVADLSLLVLLFAGVVVFVAALKDGWLALALTVPCGGIFHLAGRRKGTMQTSRATRESVIVRLLLLAPERSRADVQDALDRLYEGNWKPLSEGFSIPKSVAKSLIATPLSPQQMIAVLDHVLNTMGFTQAWLASQRPPPLEAYSPVLHAAA